MGVRSVFKKTCDEILAFFRALLAVDNTEIENALEVGYALDWYELGADFADSL